MAIESLMNAKHELREAVSGFRDAEAALMEKGARLAAVLANEYRVEGALIHVALLREGVPAVQAIRLAFGADPPSGVAPAGDVAPAGSAR